MPFRDPLVCLAAAQVVLVLPQGFSQFLCVSTGNKEAEVWQWQGSCAASMIIPTLSPCERGLISPEAGCEPGGGGKRGHAVAAG